MSFYFDSDDLVNKPSEDELEDTSFDNQDEETEEVEDGISDTEIETDTDEDDNQSDYNLTVKGKEVKLNQSQLEDAIDSYINGSQVALDEDYKFYQETKPLMTALRNDAVMRQYFQLSQNGYKPVDIIWTLLEQHRPDLTSAMRNGVNNQQHPQEEELPVFNTIEEETNYYIDKRLREQLNPINQTLQQFSQYQQNQIQEATLARIVQNNDYLINNAITSNGYTYDANALRNVIMDLYPGVDLRQLQLTPQMADRMVHLAFGNQKTNNKQSKKTDLSAITKQSKLPNLLGANAGKSRKTETPIKYAPATGTKMERIKHVDDVWDKI